MGNSSTRTVATTEEFNANIQSCFCALRAKIEHSNWDEFVTHIKALTRSDVLYFRDEYCRSILHYAAMNCDARYVKGILMALEHLCHDEANLSFLDPDCHGNTPVHLALGHNNEEGAHLILEAFPDVKYGQNRLGNTLLHLAILNDKIHCVKWLVERYPELVDVANKDGRKPADLTENRRLAAVLEHVAHHGSCEESLIIFALFTETEDAKPEQVVSASARTRIPIIPGSGLASPRTLRDSFRGSLAARSTPASFYEESVLSRSPSARSGVRIPAVPSARESISSLPRLQSSPRSSVPIVPVRSTSPRVPIIPTRGSLAGSSYAGSGVRIPTVLPSALPSAYSSLE